MRQNFVFRQGDYNLRFSSEGICATLCAAWIRMMRDEKAQSSANRKSQLINVIDSYGPIVQDRYVKGWDSSASAAANCKGILRMAGDSDIEEQRSFNSLPPSKQLIDYVSSKRRQGIHFNFAFSAGAHAIAFWRSGKDTWHASGHIYFFDPNAGEYYGNKSKYPRWFADFMRNDYGNVYPWSYLILAKPVTKPKVAGLGRRVM